MGDWLRCTKHNGCGSIKGDHIYFLLLLIAAIVFTSLQFDASANKSEGLEHREIPFRDPFNKPETDRLSRSIVSGIGAVCGIGSAIFAVKLKCSECRHNTSDGRGFGRDPERCPMCNGTGAVFDWLDFALYVLTFIGLACVCARGFLYWSDPARSWLATVGYAVFGTGLVFLVGLALKIKYANNKIISMRISGRAANEALEVAMHHQREAPEKTNSEEKELELIQMPVDPRGPGYPSGVLGFEKRDRDGELSITLSKSDSGAGDRDTFCIVREVEQIHEPASKRHLFDRLNGKSKYADEGCTQGHNVINPSEI